MTKQRSNKTDIPDLLEELDAAQLKITVMTEKLQALEYLKKHMADFVLEVDFGTGKNAASKEKPKSPPQDAQRNEGFEKQLLAMQERLNTSNDLVKKTKSEMESLREKLNEARLNNKIYSERDNKHRERISQIENDLDLKNKKLAEALANNKIYAGRNDKYRERLAKLEK